MLKVVPMDIASGLRDDKKVIYLNYHGRVICVLDYISEHSDTSVRLAFYRSSGKNAKRMNGVDYTAQEIKGKWFPIFGVTETWIHKIGIEMPTIISFAADQIEDHYQKTLKERPEIIDNMNQFYMDRINSIYKVPVKFKDLESASSIAMANYGYILYRLSLLYSLDTEHNNSDLSIYHNMLDQ